MPAFFRLTAVLFCLAAIHFGCASDGGSSSSDAPQKTKEQDPDKAALAAARAAWPEHTSDFKDPAQLAGYTTVTLVPFANLTDNSRDDDAGETFVDEIEDSLTDRYAEVFQTIRVAQTPLGEDTEVVVRGQVYDFSKGGGYNPWSGRNKAKFKAEFVLENGSTGAVLKSSRIKETGYSDNEEQLESAAKDFAKMLKRSATP